MMGLPELPELTEDCLLSVTIQGPAEEDGSVGPVTVLTAQQGDGVTTWRSSGANITDDPTVRALIAELTSLTITKCVDYHPSAAAADIGGSPSPAAPLTVTSRTAGSVADPTKTLHLRVTAVIRTRRYFRLRDAYTI